MGLVLTDDQRMIRGEAARLFAERSASEAVRRVVESGTGFDAGLWRAVACELGWCALAVPEADGGLGLGPTELVLLMEAAGERLAAIPLWSTACCAVPLLAAIAGEPARARLLPRIASGEAAVAVAWATHGRPLADPPVAARPVPGGYVLEGRVPQVIDLGPADLVLVPSRLDGGLALFALERGLGQTLRPLETLDGTRPVGELTLSGVGLPAEARLDEDGFEADDVEPALAVAQLGLAAEQVGVARGALDLTLAYVTDRVQFGRTIASFQAVKHRCARLEVDLAEARALVYGAAANDAPGERALEAAAARALASDLAFRAAEEAIQLHGGVGFTWEYDAHLYLKRAQASASLLGSPALHLECVAAALLDREAAA